MQSIDEVEKQAHHLCTKRVHCATMYGKRSSLSSHTCLLVQEQVKEQVGEDMNPHE
jgi:hypothetical protein